MKPNVDIVNLIATQELGDVLSPILDQVYFQVGKQGDLLGKRMRGDVAASLISGALGSGTILPDRYYKIGSVMPIGSSYSVNGTNGAGQINDPYLDGKIFDVHRNGLLIAKGYAWDNDVAGGGFRGLRTNDIFETDEEFILTFQPQISPYIPTPDAIARFTAGEQKITSSSSITAGMYRKLIILEGATSQLAVTLPPASAYPANVILAVISDGGSHIQAALNGNGTDKIFYQNATRATFWIGQDDQILLIPSVVTGTGSTANGWRIVYYSGADRYNRRGIVDWGYVQGKNQLVLTSDAPLLRADYPGLFDFVLALQAAQPGAVVNNATWLLNKGLWGLGDGSTTFNPPVIQGGFQRFIDPSGLIDIDRAGSNLPGTIQLAAVEKHNHITGNGPFNKLAAKAEDVLPDKGGTPGSIDNVDADKEYRVGFMKGSTWDYWAQSQIKDYGGSETRPYNIAGLPLLNF